MAKYFVRRWNSPTSRSEWLKVSLIMWWPTRDLSDYGDFESLPEKFKSLVRRSIGSKSRYLVYASVTLPDGKEVYGYSRCMDIDNPVRAYGRNRAIGTLRQKLLPLGYTVTVVD